MYQKDNPHQLTFENFYLPFGGHLRGDNRWVILADQIPWRQIEDAYGELFSDDNGCPAKSARMALGGLLIKERLGISDRETVEQISENPYLQYFLGLMEYQDTAPFDHSMLTHFRKRFDKEMLAEINDSIVSDAIEPKTPSQQVNEDDSHSTDDSSQTRPNKGKMRVDATCTPADIAYGYQSQRAGFRNHRKGWIGFGGPTKIGPFGRGIGCYSRSNRGQTVS